MNTLSNTKKVTCSKSRSTEKTIVKVSNVAYGHIDNDTLHLTRNATGVVMHSLNAFAQKNNLSVK